MVESRNTKVDLTANATWFRSFSTYGKVMVGDKAFEFYNDRNISDYVQIPWQEVTYVVADVYFHGRTSVKINIRNYISNFLPRDLDIIRDIAIIIKFKCLISDHYFTIC